MPTDHEFAQLKSQLETQDSRIDNLVARLVGAESVAANHGVEHNDRGRDPIVGAQVAGHSHKIEQTPVFKAAAVSQRVAQQAEQIITLPSGITQGDLIFIFFGANPTVSSIDWNGFTSLTKIGNDFHIGYKIADGSEGATHTIQSSTGTRMAAVTYVIGNSSADIVPDFITDTSDDDPPSLTVNSKKNYLWIAAIEHTDLSNTGPNQYEDYTRAYNLASAQRSRVGVAHRTIATLTEDPPTFNGAGGNANTITIAVHPVSTVEFGMTVGQHVVIGNATPHHADIHDYDIHTGGVPFAEVEYDDAGSDPLIDGTVSDGAENSAARKDHVHPRHHVTARPYTYSITFGWDPQSPQVFAP